MPQFATIADPRATALPVLQACENGNASDPLVAGDVVEYEPNSSAVEPGYSVVDGTADDPLVAGVVIGAGREGGNIVANAFGLIQVSGFVAGTITTDGSVASGQILFPAASAVAKSSASDAIGRMGIALAADSSTALTGAAILRGLV